MVAMLSTSLTACGGDDDDNDIVNDDDKTSENGKSDDKVLSGTIGGHEAVDLGLSVKWATCNIGASSPEGYGNYYAWGETRTKSNYGPRTYLFFNTNTLQYEDFGSNFSICGKARYDVATKNWGSKWRMPTRKELEELMSKRWNSDPIYYTRNGVNGLLIKGDNGQSIFIPANGSMTLKDALGVGHDVNLWSGTWCGIETIGCYAYAYDYFGKVEKEHVWLGMGIRPVSDASFDVGSGKTSDGDNDDGGSSSNYEKPNIAFDDYDAYTTSVKVQYRIYNKDKAKVSSAKIYYGTTSNPTSSVNASVSGVLITARITGLKKGTTYYVKCKATGKGGTTTTSTSRVQTLN